MVIGTFIQKFRDRKYISYFMYGLAILLIVFFLIRNSIVRIIFNSKCESLKNSYGLTVNADKIGFLGIRTLYIENLSVIPRNCDTLFGLAKAEVRFNFIDLIFFKVNPLEIWLDNPRLCFTGDKDSSNYSFLIYQENAVLSSNRVSTGMANNQNQRQIAIYRTLKAIFGLTTAQYHINKFEFSYTDSAYATLISIPKFESSANGFEANILVDDNGFERIISLQGLADKKSSSLSLSASMVGDKKPLPLLNHKLGLDIMFDTLNLRISAKELSHNDINISLVSSVKSLSLFSNRLSDQEVKVLKGGFDFDISIKPDYYLIDSTSSLDLNGLMANIYLKYVPKDERTLSCKINTNTFQSQELFDALPDGLFTNLKGIKTNGTIDFGLDFSIRLNNPDSLKLIPKFVTKNFSIGQYGSRNFSALNDTFSHDIYDDGQFIRTIHVGEKNKDFRTIKQISPLIVDAIVTSEDGGFFYNSGFDIDAFKYAISENIKQNRFARGGSTITMQLIKNLYLNKNKNLFRKAEEYIIVWLIGSQGVVSKERMLEIYLNIIEWGPNVYGVNEACRYYFDKKPMEVTLDEAIYLASVIPRPQKFKYLFEKDGSLKSFMQDDFNFVADKMLQRGVISEEQVNALIYNVKLSGPAKELLNDTTSYPMDSVWINENKLRRDTLLLH